MKIPRVYIDTSVIGGCFDAEFARWSNALIHNFRFGFFRPVISDIVANEINDAPINVTRKYAEIISYGAELLVANDESAALMRVIYSPREVAHEKEI